MSQLKHTPGPWKVRKHEEGGEITDCFVSANDVNGFPYDAEILGDDEYRSENASGQDMPAMERKLADCTLIAATPDLLAELQLAHTIIRNALNIMSTEQKFEWSRKNAADGCDGWGATRANEREALIAKATGGAT